MADMAGVTRTVCDGRVEWHPNNGNVERCIRIGEAASVVEMAEGVDARESPLLAECR